MNTMTEDPSQSRRFLSNALHDLGVRLQRSKKRDSALEALDESLRMRMSSVKYASALQEEEEKQSEEEETALGEMYQKTVRELNELRHHQQTERENDDDLSRLDLFPLTNGPNAAFIMPPVPHPVELDEVSNKEPSQRAESARTLHSMALCYLSKETHHKEEDLHKAEHYLAMATEILPGNRDKHLLLSANVSHAQAIVALASGRYSEAEIGASDALHLDSSIAFGVLRRSDDDRHESRRRQAQEDAANALSLLLRVYYLSGRHTEALEHFDELLRLRAGLYGRDSLRVAATVYSMGVVLLTSPGRRMSTEARECVEVFVHHPSLQLQRNSSLGSLVHADAARALETCARMDAGIDVIAEDNSGDGENSAQDDEDNEDLEFTQMGIKFHIHAAAA